MAKGNSIIDKFRRNWNWKRLIKNIKFIIKNDFEDVRYDLKDEIIEDVGYELDELKTFLPQLKVLDESETLEVLKREPKSFCRYGDGEIAIMKGEKGVFQDYDPLLASKMKKLLVEKRDNLYVGLNSSYFHTPIRYSERNRKFYRLYGTGYRRYFMEVCDPTNTYLDACCFGGYFRQNDDFDIGAHFDKIRDLFRDKKIAIVCGEGILDGFKYDIFDVAKEKMIIGAPRTNAFREYDSILEKVQKQVPKDYLVLLILGMTATVLAADLADLGYLAWDIGHCAKDYDAYKQNIAKTDEVIDKFFGAE